MEAKEFLKNPMILLLIIFGIISTIVYLGIPEDSDNFISMTYLVYLASTYISTVMLFYVVKFYGTKSFEGKVWLLISVGMLLWALGETIWYYYDAVAGVDPFPSIADVAYIVAYLPIAFAFIYKAKFTKAKFDMKKTAAIAIILILIALPTAIYVAGPILADEGVLDMDGNAMDDAPYYYFMTAEDGVMPDTFIVADEEVYDVAVNATIVMELDPSVDIDSVEEMFGLYDIDWEYIDGTFEWNGTTVTFTPDEALEPGAEYEAEVYIGYGSLEKGISLLYPMLDLVLLAFALFIAFYWGSSVSGGWYIVSIAIALTTLADIGFTFLDWQGLSFPPMDLLWVASYLAFAMGGIYQKMLHESFM